MNLIEKFAVVVFIVVMSFFFIGGLVDVVKFWWRLGEVKGDQ